MATDFYNVQNGLILVIRMLAQDRGFGISHRMFSEYGTI